MKEHDYTSKECIHLLHHKCNKRCEFCNILCGCECHDDDRDKDSTGIDERETLARG
jgi:hypothetical protein